MSTHLVANHPLILVREDGPDVQTFADTRELTEWLLRQSNGNAAEHIAFLQRLAVEVIPGVLKLIDTDHALRTRTPRTRKKVAS